MFVSSQLQSFREQVQEYVSDHGVEGIGAYTVLANSISENFETTSKDGSHLHRVSDDQGVELAFDVSWNDLENQAKPNSSRNHIASTIRKSAEVSLRQLDQKGRKGFEVAKSAEIQSWLRYEAVTAALRSQYHHRDIMKMRWVLRYKQSDSTFGDYWLSRSSRRFRKSGPRHQLHHVVEEVCFSWQPLTISSPLKKGDVKNAFLQGTFDDNVVNGELAAEPVPELRKALNLHEDEIVVLTKACYGLIDAPRRWWKSLVRDTQL